jgi:hypothetical protein
MRSFAVGDRVRALQGCEHYFQPGATGTVLRIPRDGTLFVQWDEGALGDGQWWIDSSSYSVEIIND